MPVSAELREKREQIVRGHMELENRHEFDATLDTFEHPRYELIGTGDVYDGRDEVARYFDETRSAFPDQENGADRAAPRRRRGDRRGVGARHAPRAVPGHCRRPGGAGSCSSPPCSCSRRTD